MAVASRPVIPADRASECSRGPTARRSRSRLHPDRELVATFRRRRARLVRRACARRAAARHVLGDRARDRHAPAARGIYVGYSMGGRLCLRLALDRPDLVRGLMLVSTSPGIADPTERAARVEADELLADSVERDGVRRVPRELAGATDVRDRAARRAGPGRSPPAHVRVPRRVPAPARRRCDGADVGRSAAARRCRCCW